MCYPGPVDAPLSTEVLCSGVAQGALPPAGLPPGCVASVILGCPAWSIVRPCYGAARREPSGVHRRPAATAYDDRDSPFSLSPAPHRPSLNGTPSPGEDPLTEHLVEPRVPRDLKAFIAGLPKAELHVHHVGSASPRIVSELAARHPDSKVPTDP